MRFFRCTALARGRRRDRFYEAVRGLQNGEALKALQEAVPPSVHMPRDAFVDRFQEPRAPRTARARGSLSPKKGRGTTHLHAR